MQASLIKEKKKKVFIREEYLRKSIRKEESPLHRICNEEKGIDREKKSFVSRTTLRIRTFCVTCALYRFLFFPYNIYNPTDSECHFFNDNGYIARGRKYSLYREKKTPGAYIKTLPRILFYERIYTDRCYIFQVISRNIN